MNLHSPQDLPLVLERSHVFLGDAFSLVKRIPDNSLNLVLCSPPYNIGKSYEKGMFLSFDAYREEMSKLVDDLARKVASSGSVCWQVGNYVEKGAVYPLDYLFFELFAANGLKLRNRIVWRFNFGLHARRRFSGRYETILWFTKSDDYTFNLDPIRVPQIYPGKRKKTNKGYLPSGNPKGKNPSDFWEFDAAKEFADGAVWDIPNVKANHPEKTAHPCQFPNEIVDRCLLALTNKGDVVLDPFAGVGTTIACATARERIGIGFELEPDYRDDALKRMALAANGELKVRPSGKPVRRPRHTEKVSRVPEEWQSEAPE